MTNKVTAVVLAAGQGKRMNSSVAKQFLLLHDKPVICYSLEAFEQSSIDEVILVTGEDQVEYCREQIVAKYRLKKVTNIIEGGKERYDSVYQALLHTSATDYVLIHDGARPFLTKELIEHIVSQVVIHKACIIGTPVKETIKRVDQDSNIVDTPDRSVLWAAQTPQAFEYQSIRKAYELFYEERAYADVTATDDAMLYEQYIKKPVKMLMGDYNNIKLTTPEDLLIAESILRVL